MNYLTEYQTFSTKHELNEAINAHLTEHKYGLNETDRDTLLTISRYAVKFPGAAHLKAATLADIVGKSVITVRRTINKLVGLRIIKKIPFIRKVKKGFGANLLIVLPFYASNDKSGMITRSADEKPCPVKDEAVKNENEPFYNINNNILKDTYKAVKTAPLYRQFIDMISNTIGYDKKLISRLFGVFKAKKTNDSVIGMLALKTSLMALKTFDISNLAGYYSGVLDRMMTGDAMPAATNKKAPTRVEMLPSWFTNPTNQAAEIDNDDEFLQMKAALEQELKNRD